MYIFTVQFNMHSNSGDVKKNVLLWSLRALVHCTFSVKLNVLWDVHHIVQHFFRMSILMFVKCTLIQHYNAHLR
jgi:hypothetical protein